MQKEVVLEDPLHWLQEVGPQGQRVPQRFLALPEEFDQHLVPHALSEHCHRPAEGQTVISYSFLLLCNV
jgi:hypothetical protein